MTCQYAELDGSYVLGSLSPAERQDFVGHLSSCPECTSSVCGMAGLPGLMARVDPAVLESAPELEPVPETLLPRLLREVRRTRRIRRFATLGLAAAAAIAVGALVVQGVGGDRVPAATPWSAGASADAGRAMLPVGDVPVRATVALGTEGWGTRVALTCSYEEGDDYQLPASITYSLVVVDRDGTTEEVGTWRALRGRTVRLSVSTATKREDIASVEVRAGGSPVLRLSA